MSIIGSLNAIDKYLMKYIGFKNKVYVIYMSPEFIMFMINISKWKTVCICIKSLITIGISIG